MPLSKQENERRAIARRLIAEGRLPNVEMADYWDGRGYSNSICALCAKTIGADDVQLEVETGKAAPAARIYRFHFLCHAAWQLECARGRIYYPCRTRALNSGNHMDESFAGGALK